MGLHITVAILLDAATIVCALAVPPTVWILGDLNCGGRPAGKASLDAGAGGRLPSRGEVSAQSDRCGEEVKDIIWPV